MLVFPLPVKIRDFIYPIERSPIIQFRKVAFESEENFFFYLTILIVELENRKFPIFSCFAHWMKERRRKKIWVSSFLLFFYTSSCEISLHFLYVFLVFFVSHLK